MSRDTENGIGTNETEPTVILRKSDMVCLLKSTSTS